MSEKNNVRIFRLLSGEEIVAEYNETPNDTYLLKNCAIIIPGGRGNIALSPWMPYAASDDGIEIPNRSIAFSIEPHEALLEEYNDAFSSDAGKPKLWQPYNTLVGAAPTPSSLKIADGGPVKGD
ncbi:MAG: hypothetical protein H8D80_02075 [Proteobacteria bacterium]|nr:hypothetical protein [Pseudomonadota bacterium]